MKCLSRYIMSSKLCDFLKTKNIDLLFHPRILDALFAFKAAKTKAFVTFFFFFRKSPCEINSAAISMFGNTGTEEGIKGV